jgi:endogenous inhibitor of DNA gyrase (YacG/DUF329 family)
LVKRSGCPLCGNATSAEAASFCSRGCKDRDLLQWLGEGYRIPAEPVDPEALSGVDSANDPD